MRAEDTIVEKPWGYEVRWALTDRYCGKILHVQKGEALSLHVVRGCVDTELGADGGELKTHRMREGDSVHLTPGTRHRLTAVEDTDIYEVSTSEVDDVVRLEDRYGRAGQ
jgi:mannose-6-phosphate isomerase-like protein (cupin superfamily)